MDTSSGSSRPPMRQLYPAVPQGRIWVAYALVAMCLFAFSAFLTVAVVRDSANASDAGSSCFQLQALISGVAGLGMWAALKLRGLGLSVRTRRLAVARVASGVALGLGHVFISHALTDQGASSSLVLAVLPFSAAILASVCWKFHGESITVPQCIALATLLAGLVMQALANGTSGSAAGLGFGLIAAVCYAAGDFGIKDGNMRGVHNEPLVAMLFLGVGAVGVVGFFVSLAANGSAFAGLGELAGEPPVASGRLFAFAVASGLIQAAALGSMALAFVFGGAAPAAAIVTSNLSGVILLNAALFDHEVKALQVVGFVFCAAGVVALALVPPSSQRIARGGVKASPAPSAAAPLDEISLHAALQGVSRTATDASVGQLSVDTDMSSAPSNMATDYSAPHP